MGDEVSLTFDPKEFLTGLEKITKKFAKMETVTGAAMGGVGKKIAKVGVSFGSILKGGIGLSALSSVFNKFKSAIPEIGKAFSTAGDIMLKNLVLPLRKAVLPILKKMLDWVRAHRVMFIKFGSVIKNVFLAIVEVVKMLWKALKSFWEGLSSGIVELFGRTKDSIVDTANLILFKLTAIGIFIMAIFKPLAKKLGEIFGSILKHLKAFVSGFATGFGEVTPHVERVVELFQRLYNMLSSGFSRGFISDMKTLGVLLGVTLAGSISVVIDLFDRLITQIAIMKIGWKTVTGDISMVNADKLVRKLRRGLEIRLLQSEMDRLKNKIRAGGELRNITEAEEKRIQKLGLRNPADVIGPPEKRALGGPVLMGKPYLVGEKGREIFIPDSDGRVVTNNQTENLINRSVNNQTDNLVNRSANRVTRNNIKKEQNKVVNININAPITVTGQSNAKQTAEEISYQLRNTIMESMFRQGAA